MILAFRRHTLLPLDDCLYALQPSIPHLTRSALHRCLQRHGISRLPDVEGDKPKRQKFKCYPTGFFHIDIVELQTAEGKLYLFVLSDKTGSAMTIVSRSLRFLASMCWRRANNPGRHHIFMVLALALAPASALAQPLRLVALGDSLTQGYGLPQDQGLVPQLQAWLRAAGHDVIVINAGVSGNTTAGGLSRLDWTLADKPDAMIVALGGNDLLRGIDPAASRANLDAILTRLGAEGVPAMLVGLPAPGNYGPDFQQEFQAMYPDLAQRHGAALYPDLFSPITQKHRAGESLDGLMQDDGLHPSAAGVGAIVAAMGPAVEAWLTGIEASAR